MCVCRFLAADTPAPPAPSTQPFSFTSTPKPAAAPDSSAQPKPVFTISKPAAAPTGIHTHTLHGSVHYTPAPLQGTKLIQLCVCVFTVTRPAPAQNSAPSVTVQKTAPAPSTPSAAPSTQVHTLRLHTLSSHPGSFKSLALIIQGDRPD